MNNNFENNITNDWTIVTYKQKKHNKLNYDELNYDILNNIKDININDIIVNTICNNNYNPEYIFLYGSRARKTNRSNSDVDLLVFWKYPVPSYNELLFLKELLTSNLKLGLDFVNMRITNKNIIVNDERTICYYDNVSRDAICIYTKNKTHDKINNKININDLFEISERIKN